MGLAQGVADARAVSAEGRHGAVATVHPLASEAALRVLRQGGNAVDAAVAAALTLGVVDGFNSGIGGGCLLLLHRANGELIAIDGREMAPSAAHRDMFLQDGKPQPQRSQVGPLAVAVPGALAAYELAVREYGQQSLSDVLLPAAELAERGHVLSATYVQALTSAAAELALDPAAREIFLLPDRSAPTIGSRLVQVDLARTYRQIATQGVDWFYRGEFAQRTEDWMRQQGGLLTANDFQNYRALRREPVQTEYRGYTIVGFPPPSSGGLHVAQMLHMLEPYDLGALYRDDRTQTLHLLAEVMKRAFADRAHWLGDADFVNVPRGLLDPNYAHSLMANYRDDQVVAVPRYGQPPGANYDFFPPARHTTHIATADNAGNWVALTATINTTFGAKVVVPGTGVVLNNEMDDFSIQPGLPNAFGLVGGEQNAIAPGKRPLSSMSPTLVLQDQRPRLSVGAAGGPRIISQVMSVLVRVLDGQQGVAEALAAPRIHHQWSPDRLEVEPTLELAVREALQRRGHQVEVVPALARVQAIYLQPDGKTMTAASDPRVESSAMAW